MVFYRNAKKSFFSTSDENNIVSIDNDLGREIHSENKLTLTVSVNDKTANLHLENNLIKTPWGDLTNYLPFKSKFMISNFLCALGLYGKIFDEIDFEAEMLKNLKNLPGRLQKISLFQDKIWRVLPLIAVLEGLGVRNYQVFLFLYCPLGALLNE